MIKVKIKPNSIIISGHAGYDVSGKDIVCASVSAVAMTTLNAMLLFNSKAIKYETSEGLLKIDIINDDETTRKLMDNMIDVLENIKDHYPKNIKVER